MYSDLNGIFIGAGIYTGYRHVIFGIRGRRYVDILRVVTCTPCVRTSAAGRKRCCFTHANLLIGTCISSYGKDIDHHRIAVGAAVGIGDSDNVFGIAAWCDIVRSSDGTVTPCIIHPARSGDAGRFAKANVLISAGIRCWQRVDSDLYGIGVFTAKSIGYSDAVLSICSRTDRNISRCLTCAPQVIHATGSRKRCAAAIANVGVSTGIRSW